MPQSDVILRACVIGIAACTVPVTARGHEGLHEQIAAMTTRISVDAGDAALYLRRGELYRLHGETDAALADFARVRELEPAGTKVHFALARTLLDRADAAGALAAVERYLSHDPDNGAALLVQARALVQLQRHGEAERAYTAAIDRLETPQPEHYLERARAQTAAGAEHLLAAIRGLDEGVARLGPVPGLQLYAIELELRLGNTDAALRRIDGMARRANRKETWLERRGEVLEQARRFVEAREAYAASLTAIERLPRRARSHGATMELETRVRAALQRLFDGMTNPPPATAKEAAKETESRP